jgi:hypothetical protein
MAYGLRSFLLCVQAGDESSVPAADHIAFCSWWSGDARSCTALDHLVCGLVRVMNWVSLLLFVFSRF